MMISDEPDEDADALDDDTAIESLLGDGSARRDDVAPPTVLPEWPAHDCCNIELQIDAATIAWFRSSYPNWQRQMGLVLRAWMNANTANDTPRG